ncbi:MAG: cysteine desulfurase NifS [Proteobacteria bacterium]|nr:cysteine desulfurase NifS [Pseudomonadota bacterium]
MEPIYLDHSATTPIRPEVLEAMYPYFTDIFGNASSIHTFGQKAKKALEEARGSVARLIGAHPSEIVFTSGGTEADNLAIKGAALAREEDGHIITSTVEHPAVLAPCHDLEKRGFKVSFLPVDHHGLVDPDDVRKAITDRTVLISIMHANHEVGTVEPLEEIAKLAMERDIPFHTDAIQSVGKVPIDVETVGVNLLTLSAHKLYGPKGVGALYIRRGTKILPQVLGGHQEVNLRAGTENVGGIIGLGKAAEIALLSMEAEGRKISRLRDGLWKEIREHLGPVKLNGHPVRRLPNILNVTFDGIEGESILINLDLKGIAVSTGSACTSGSLEPSHVLLAMGRSPTMARESVRFSLGIGNTREEMEYTVTVLGEVVRRLRSTSSLNRSAMAAPRYGGKC